MEQSVSGHGDWIRSCTDSSFDVTTEGLVVYSIDRASGRKRYFRAGGAFWTTLILDDEGNILDVLPQGGLCMSLDELSERSSLDLTRVVRPEVCVSD